MLDRMFSQNPTIHKYDRIWVGVLLGLIVPVTGVLVVYLLSVVNHFLHLPFLASNEVLSIPTLIKNISSVLIFTKFLSVGCILNLGVFFLFINRDYFNIARGIIFATMLIAMPIIVLTIKGWFA
jgi:hypothetical protein